MSQIDDHYFSSKNHSTTLLGANETFTGDWEYVGRHRAIGFSVYSSSAGTLYVDYASLDSNGDRVVRTLPAYYVGANEQRFHSLQNFRPYVRLRFVNGSVAQTDFDLNLSVGDKNQPVTPTQFSYDLYTDATITREVANDIDIAAGRAGDVTFLTKFGRNEAVSGLEDIAFQGGTYAGFPINPTPETFTVLSTSTDDTLGGAGAEKIRLFYLDDNFNLATVDVNLNGTAGATTTVTGVRVWRAIVLQSANGANTAFNVGDITVRHTTTTANVFMVIDAGKSQSEVGGFTVPNEHVLLVENVTMAMEKSGGSTTATCGIWVREFNAAPRIIETGSIAVGQPYENSGKLVFPAKTDFIARILSISTGSQSFTCLFNGKLIRTSKTAS